MDTARSIGHRRYGLLHGLRSALTNTMMIRRRMATRIPGKPRSRSDVAIVSARPPRALRSLLILLLVALGGRADVHAVAPPGLEEAGPARTFRFEHEPSRVLVLFSGSRLLPANILFDESLRQSLLVSPGGPVECCGEFLDEVDFPVRYRPRMLELLREKYRGHPPDAVVTFGPPSLEFLLGHRAELFPEIPIVFAGMNAVPGIARSDSGITGVRSSFDVPATLRLALSLHPRTRQVCVIPGLSGDGVAGADSLYLREDEFRIPFDVLDRRPLPELLERLSELPENSLVIDLSGFDASADSLAPTPPAVMQRISDVSRGPIYGVSDPLVENGLVGAVTTPMDSLGRTTAALVIQVLSRGELAGLPPVQDLASAPLFDWRQLRRWGLRTGQLPPGSIVRFEPPSFWRQHFLLVITTGALFLLQTGLILALVLQSRRRRRAELDARKRREELAHMTRVATMGELTASLAHEINQPLAAILSNAQAAQRLLATGDGQVEEIQDILADIAADDQRAGEVIRRMRTLLRKEDSNPTEVDVNELVDEVVGLVGGEMILQNVSLALDLSSRLGRVHGDRVQLQQVLLNLIVNALDAMKEMPGGSRRVVVRTVAAGPRSVQVSVQDTGVGIAADKRDQIFEPFVTTKPHGMGLGLSICRSIIQAHGGRIGAKENGGRGTTFWFTLPTLEEVKQ